MIHKNRVPLAGRAGVTLAVWMTVLSLTAPFALAARSGVVAGDDVQVYDSPSPSGNILEKLKKGAPIAASNVPTQGFHKVRTQAGIVGWVAAGDLNLNSFAPRAVAESPRSPAAESPPVSSASEGSEKSPPIFRLRVFGDANLFSTTTVLVNSTLLSQGVSYGAELIVRLDSHWGLMVRAESFSKSSVLTDATGRIFDLNIASLPVMGGIEYSFLKGERLSLQLSVLAGMALSTSLTSTDTTDTPPPDNVANIVASNIVAMSKLTGNWQLSRRFSLFAELGYFYSNTPVLSSPGGNGSLILEPTFTLDLSGPVVGGGFSVCF